MTDPLVDIIEQAIYETDTGLAAALLAADRIRAEAAAGPPEGTHLVLVADGLLEALADRVDWGEPDEHGWYVPTLYRAEATAGPRDLFAASDLDDPESPWYDDSAWVPAEELRVTTWYERRARLDRALEDLAVTSRAAIRKDFARLRAIIARVF